jgi:hypothetical protein
MRSSLSPSGVSSSTITPCAGCASRQAGPLGASVGVESEPSSHRPGRASHRDSRRCARRSPMDGSGESFSGGVLAEVVAPQCQRERSPHLRPVRRVEALEVRCQVRGQRLLHDTQCRLAYGVTGNGVRLAGGIRRFGRERKRRTAWFGSLGLDQSTKRLAA